MGVDCHNDTHGPFMGPKSVQADQYDARMLGSIGVDQFAEILVLRKENGVPIMCDTEDLLIPDALSFLSDGQDLRPVARKAFTN